MAGTVRSHKNKRGGTGAGATVGALHGMGLCRTLRFSFEWEGKFLEYSDGRETLIWLLCGNSPQGRQRRDREMRRAIAYSGKG